MDKWCKEIDEEESKREQEALNHAKWLKQRDLRKQEIERAWRPPKTSLSVNQKRKIPDIIDNFIDNEREINSQLPQRESTLQYQQYLTPQQTQQKSIQYSHQMIPSHEVQHQSQQQIIHVQSHESAKPALSPLLTSLLKSPSQVQNLSSVPTSILHNAITSQNNKLEAGNNSSPTISSLLNASTSNSMNSSLQQFSTCRISQDTNSLVNDDSSQPLDADILDDANIKIDDLAKSILVQDGPFPEIKKEEVDDIISEIIENAHDIVSDPEQHLQLDGNGDININLELDDLEEDTAVNEEIQKTESSDNNKIVEASPLPTPIIDPFEFQEDPVLFESPVKPSSLKQDNTQYTPLYQHSPIKSEEIIKKDTETEIILPSTLTDKPQLSKNVHGSVEIVEVAAEEHENEKEFNKAQILDIVHSNKNKEEKIDSGSEELCQADTRESNKYDSSIASSENLLENEESLKIAPIYFEQKVNTHNSDTNFPSLSQDKSISDYADDLYDNINMEVKIDKTGKTKRDYSRTKKKEEKSFDMLLAIEKAHLDDMNISDDLVEYKVENQKKDVNIRLKSENERSTSPWTEEEDSQLKASKRRYSSPGTPIDSMPNSPASSTVYYDDDKDYRNWKKSVMLVYNRLASNKYASLFLKPITDEQAPGYSTVVYRPMDMQTIKKNIDNGIIRTSLEFKRDVMLMFTNAIMYNKTNDTVYNMALQMQQESINPIEILLQAQVQVDAPIRRETRTSESNCKRKRICDEPVKNKKKKDE